jgi:predicted transcriptional regulator YdeE
MKYPTLILTLFSLFAPLSAHPFHYDLDLTEINATNSDSVMICFHGMGGNYTIGQMITACAKIDEKIVSFNFPDAGLSNPFDPSETSFGTIGDLLPGLFILKKYIVEEKIPKADLYGFSAGGGAIINILAVLNTNTYDQNLLSIGITEADKKQILNAIEKGLIILDVPLKSVAEIIDFRGKDPNLVAIGERYIQNDMEPIDSIKKLSGLSLHFIVFFQTPDLILSNRDDDLFIERLKEYNSKGTTVALFGQDGGHSNCHSTLWRYYEQEMSTMKVSEKEKLVVGLKIRTSNATQPQEASALWGKVMQENTFGNIPHRLNKDLLSVYTDYEGDYTKPYSYMVCCEVSKIDSVPAGFTSLRIPSQEYAVFTAKGPFPQVLAKTWQEVWSADIVRAYATDFEVYGPDFNPHGSPEVKLYISVK